jgi:acid phosphatase (class A)
MSSAGRVLACTLLVVASPLARGADQWLAPDAVELPRLLPPPPAADSEAGRRDLAAVLALQAARTASDVAQAQADQKVSVFRFADVLGDAFTAERVPKTAALAERACREAASITARAKKHWQRPRPAVADTAVKPVVAIATDGAYPSGHATCGYLWAIVLGDMLPEKRAELFARGVRYGTNRIVGGVHYPTDAEAGRLGAAVIATALFANPAFRTALEAASAETRAALGYAAVP